MRHHRQSDGGSGNNVIPSPRDPGQELRRWVAPVLPSQRSRFAQYSWLTNRIYDLSGGKILVSNENTLENLGTTWIAYFDCLGRDTHLFRRENIVVTYRTRNHISQ